MTDTWRDRRGPLGSIEEQEYCDQRNIPYVDPIVAIKGILRAIRLEEPVRITSRERDGLGGYKLTDRMVTRLEVLNALSRLPFPLREAIAYTQLQGMTRQQAARELNVSDPTLGKYLQLGYAALIRMVFDYGATP